MTINVFPAQQGFPRPPDGGVPAPTFIDVNNTSQAFAPAPLVNPFPIEPTPPANPFLPASQGVPPVPVKFEVVPPAVDVNLMADLGPPTNAPTYVVTDVGSLGTIVQESREAYTIQAVYDHETGGSPPQLSTLNIRLTLYPNNKPLNSFGVPIVGRTVAFTSGAWWFIPPPPPLSLLSRPIVLNNDFTIVVPNKDTNGVPFNYPANGPAPNDTIEIDVAWYNGQDVFRNLGIVQNVIPETSPLLPELGTIQTDLPIQEVDVSNQETVVGTPIESSPNRQNDYLETSMGTPIDVFPGRQDATLGIPINVFPGRQNT